MNMYKAVKLICLIGFFIIPVIVSAQPRMEIIGGDTVRWENVKVEQSPVKRDIKIVNKGDQLLTIKRVNPACGCTTAPIDKSELKTGDTATISITLNLPNRDGIMHKIITVLTNDPDNKSKVIHLIADVIFPLSFFPAQEFHFPGILVGDTLSTRVVISNTTEQDIIIKDIVITPDIASVTLKNDDVIPAGKDIVVDVTAIPVVPGIISGELQFKTTHPDLTRVKIPVVINVQGVKPFPSRPIKF
jgi:hypothetical protein